MTLIAGYIYNNAVHIIADSAVTTLTWEDKGNTNNESSFMEVSTFEKDKYVEEVAQKIFNIDNKILIAFAGKEYAGLQVVEDLYKGYQSCNKIFDFILQYFEGIMSNENHFIIGFYENESPYLLYFFSPSNKGYVKDNGEASIAGKNPGINPNSLKEGVVHGLKNGYGQDDQLINMIMAYQLVTISTLSFAEGIGGHINGAYVDQNGVTWAKDTIYLLYSGNTFEQGVKYTIYKYNRDNSSFVSNYQQCKYFNNDFDEEQSKHKYEKWYTEINTFAKQTVSDYIIALSYDSPNSIAINRINGNSQQILIQEGNFIISHEIAEVMFPQQLIHKETGTFYLQLRNNFISNP